MQNKKSHLYRQSSYFDGIELSVNFYCLYAFFSHYFNKRTDKWGGSLENRSRFILAVLDEIRSIITKQNPELLGKVAQEVEATSGAFSK